MAELRPVPRSVVPLMAAAMAIFVITVVIGILNGLDIWEVPHGPLMAHVHSGTLGWITLSVFAGAAWVVGGDKLSPALVWASIISVAAYVVAFYLSLIEIRPYTGALMFLVMVWFAIWVFTARAGKPLTVPSLGVALSMISLVIGGLLGVLLGLMMAGVVSMPAGIGGAHPAMMVAGYLVLAGAALAEQLLAGPGTEQATRPGVTQQILLFLAGIVLALGLLMNIEPLLGLNALFQIVGTGFIVVRLFPLLKGWGEAGNPLRNGAIAVVYLVPATILLVVIIAQFISGGEPPANQLIALDHLIFVGVLTNVIFGMLLAVTSARRSVMAGADQIVFWGMNLGLIIFAIALLAEIQVLKQIGTPIMGLAILLGLGVFASRLSGGSAEATPQAD